MKKHTQRKTIAVAIINKVFKEMDTRSLIVTTSYVEDDKGVYNLSFRKGTKQINVRLHHDSYEWNAELYFCKWEPNGSCNVNYKYYVKENVNEIFDTIKEKLEP